MKRVDVAFLSRCTRRSGHVVARILLPVLGTVVSPMKCRVLNGMSRASRFVDDSASGDGIWFSPGLNVPTVRVTSCAALVYPALL